MERVAAPLTIVKRFRDLLQRSLVDAVEDLDRATSPSASAGPHRFARSRDSLLLEVHRDGKVVPAVDEGGREQGLDLRRHPRVRSDQDALAIGAGLARLDARRLPDDDVELVDLEIGRLEEGDLVAVVEVERVRGALGEGEMHRLLARRGHVVQRRADAGQEVRSPGCAVGGASFGDEDRLVVDRDLESFGVAGFVKLGAVSLA